MIVLFKKNKTLVFGLAEGRAANVSRLSGFALAIWNPEMIYSCTKDVVKVQVYSDLFKIHQIFWSVENPKDNLEPELLEALKKQIDETLNVVIVHEYTREFKNYLNDLKQKLNG